MKRERHRFQPPFGLKIDTEGDVLYVGRAGQEEAVDIDAVFRRA